MMMPPRVLIVDDSASARDALAIAAQAAFGDDATIDEAQSGYEALVMFPRGALDLVVADVHMPDVTGLELLAFVRAHPMGRAIPCVLVSASLREKERSLALGADAFLHKPFALREAELLFRRFLRRAEPA